MPLYEYIHDPTGETIEEFMAMTDQHPETIERDGKTYRRVFGNSHMRPMWKPYTSMRHGANLPGADGYDKQGRAYIGSQRTEKRFMALNGLKRD